MSACNQIFESRVSADAGPGSESTQIQDQGLADFLDEIFEARLRNEFDYSSLNESSKLSYPVFEYEQQRKLRNFKWRHHIHAISQMDDIASDLPTFLQNLHKIETVKDAGDYISRNECATLRPFICILVRLKSIPAKKSLKDHHG